LQNLVYSYGERDKAFSSKTDSKVVNESFYRKLVGSSLYLIVIRPNLSYTTSFISIFMTLLKVEHWTTTNRVLKYVKGTLDFSILYSRSKDPMLCGHTYSNWASCVDDRKTTYKYVFSLGTREITGTNKKQLAVALTLIEIEY